MTRSTDPGLPPTWTDVARRPRWIAALFGVLLVAVVFALLAQWQLGRAVQSAVSTEQLSGAPVPLASINTPGTPVMVNAGGRIVTASGRFVPGDTDVLRDRLRVGAIDPIGGEKGYWLVAGLLTDDGRMLTVALGYSTSRAAMDAAAAALTDAQTGAQSDAQAGAETTVEGRYLPPESPDEDNVAAGEHTALATSALVNSWNVTGPMYDGFVVAATPPAGLERIVAPAPEDQTGLNLLNVFYGLEWALFCGFALYLWWRLVKDVVERETEEADAIRAARAASASGPASG